MRIAVIGTGYVGLVSGVCLASKDHFVTCFDTNEDIINHLSSGNCHIYEPGLDDLIKSCKTNINFRFLNDQNKKEITNFVIK